jgi:hypothetical protein
MGKDARAVSPCAAVSSLGGGVETSLRVADGIRSQFQENGGLGVHYDELTGGTLEFLFVAEREERPGWGFARE